MLKKTKEEKSYWERKTMTMVFAVGKNEGKIYFVENIKRIRKTLKSDKCKERQ